MFISPCIECPVPKIKDREFQEKACTACCTIPEDLKGKISRVSTLSGKAVDAWDDMTIEMIKKHKGSNIHFEKNGN